MTLYDSVVCNFIEHVLGASLKSTDADDGKYGLHVYSIFHVLLYVKYYIFSYWRHVNTADTI